MKSILKTIFIAIIFTFLQQIAFAQDANKTVTLVVSGQGKTQDEAKQNALRSAIEQAFGTFISSKTEILNDQVVSDQIASVSNGNIHSFSVLNESQLPDGSWGVTLKAIVSVDKLTSFVEAKGIAIEIKGGMFALNIKQQLLNEQGEIKAICEMVGLLHEPMQISFDYEIKSSEPKSLDAESKNWVIPLVVTATTNKNIDFCANYCIKTLAALSLSAEEVATYESLNKAVFHVVIKYNGVTKTFYLRSKFSIKALYTLIKQWDSYTRLFRVHSGTDELNGKEEKEEQIHIFNNNLRRDEILKLEDESRQMSDVSINFLTTGKEAARFSWKDKRTLAQIEQMTGYNVKPRGVVSQFKHGGFVVYEKNGHGLVASLIDIGDCNYSWESAKNVCEQIVLNGYGDWYLPTIKELELINNTLNKEKLGALKDYNWYWSKDENKNNVYQALLYMFNKDFKESERKYRGKIALYSVRAVRIF
jgi:hypothetical protein